MKSNSNNSIEVNPSPEDFTSPPENKSSLNNLKQMKLEIKHCLLSRAIISIIIISYIINKINDYFDLVFSNIPLYTISKLELYRLITNFFICESLYELFISIIMISTVVNNFENKEGTILFFCKFVFNLIISQLLLLFIYLVISYIYPIVFIYRINIREFLCISYLVKHLLTTEDKKIYNPFFGKFNDRLLILFFILIYFYLNHEFRIEHIFCLYYGFMMCKYKNILDLEFLTSKYIEYIESSNFGKILKISEFFVSFQTSDNQINKNNFSNLPINQSLYKKGAGIKDENVGLKTDLDFENDELII